MIFEYDKIKYQAKFNFIVFLSSLLHFHGPDTLKFKSLCDIFKTAVNLRESSHPTYLLPKCLQ